MLDHEICKQVPFISGLNGYIVLVLSFVSIIAIITFLSICIGVDSCGAPPNSSYSKAPKCREDSPEGAKEREQHFLLATALLLSCVPILWFQQLVYRFSEHCAEDPSSATGCAVLMMCVSLALLPCAFMAVVNLGRDIWEGKRVDERWPRWMAYVFVFWMLGRAVVKILHKTRSSLDRFQERQYVTVDGCRDEQQHVAPPEYAEIASGGEATCFSV